MAIVDKKIEIKKSGSAMTSAISQLVYMPNFRAIGQSVWEKNGNTQTDRKTETQKDRKTDTLEFYKDRLVILLVSSPCHLLILKDVEISYLLYRFYKQIAV